MATRKHPDCNIGNGKTPEVAALGTPLACDYCHAEIPAKTAYNFEGVDYIYHFCGPACLDTWCKAANAERK